MAGGVRLEGVVAEKATQMLNEVVDILDRNNVEYMLDCGTLLGVIRENRLLPWDTDVDLCIDSSQLPKIKSCMRSLWLKGYRVRLARSFEATEHVADKSPRILKVRTRKKLFHRGDNLLDIFIKYDGGDGYHYSILGSSKDNYIIQRTPSEYMYNRSFVFFNGREFPIPEDYSGYLTYRYGNWKAPVKEWSVFTDDLSCFDRVQGSTS